ncbi:type II toxin-antitoxin system HicB family antitoxin [Komarekiella sp. 'clone 1']|uniref:Type II toxin-antitoxin system HicB family antitoxin n=1 Tax=Komarekiella delphini-convector SJRDD-AB1 TaxID=2593771 RepID=A0AA40VPM7_9NOST|nr:type II toxin-antitoxin system HicB family antitoxin [Komarekiella delphini-convector]MBD6615477.1 type II toxin-antitoxin system HicB family antitoxin [Komarekiella delphini-convector SJRDD-AB1]
MMLHYEIILYWSEEDTAFIAEVPELPGCAADGETYQEALQNVEIVMQEWIEVAKDLGRQIPQPRRRLISLAKDKE